MMKMKKKLLVMVLTLVLLIGMSVLVMANPAEDSANFDISIQIWQPISIEITDNIIFEQTYAGAHNILTEITTATVTGEDGENYTIEFTDGGNITLEGTTTDTISVSLSHNADLVLTDGEEVFEITATIPEDELVDVDSGSYSGQATVTVAYAD